MVIYKNFILWHFLMSVFLFCRLLREHVEQTAHAASPINKSAESGMLKSMGKEETPKKTNALPKPTEDLKSHDHLLNLNFIELGEALRRSVH